MGENEEQQDEEQPDKEAGISKTTHLEVVSHLLLLLFLVENPLNPIIWLAEELVVREEDTGLNVADITGAESLKDADVLKVANVANDKYKIEL